MPRLLLMCATIASALTCLAADPAPVVVSGTELKLDDALFHGCFHNAFEGEPLELEDGKWKAGPQTIRRTKGVLTGRGTGHDVMTLRFTLKALPAGDSTLLINGLNDRLARTHDVAVSVNDRVLADAIQFPHNKAPELGLNQRYYVGWEDRQVTVPADALRVGENTLTIRNLTDAFDADTWPFVVVDTVAWHFATDTEMTVQPPPTPRFYYGLHSGVETHIWPVVAYGDSMTLLSGLPLEYNFFATFPRQLPLGTDGPLDGEPTRPEREIMLHIWTDAAIDVTQISGEAIAPESVDGGSLFKTPIARIINFETPHPSQGVRVFMQGRGPSVTGKRLRAWYTVDGVAYAANELPLSIQQLEPVANREQLGMELSIWGGTAPQEPEALAAYVRLLKAVGVNQVFTGDSPALNASLKAEGFTVYPRYGWFGHGFAVSDETQQWAAITAAGKPLPKDYCPLAILANADHPELGRFFALARRFAALENIDGICVDFECAPVWCWCDNCLALFREETGITNASRENTGRGQTYEREYKEFGRRRNRDLLARVKLEMQSVNPDLRYLALASANDVPAYWYDPRNARHSIRELTTFADEIFISQYCYETPGGFKSIRPVIQTVERFGLASGRRVNTSMIAPVAQTVSEYPRYRDASMRPEMTQAMIMLAGLNGGKSLSFFRGDCFDGSQYLALRHAVDELIQLQPYMQAAIDRTEELTLSATHPEDRRFEVEMAQNLLSRFVWRPQVQYFYDHVMLLRDGDGHDRLLALFNFSDAPLELQLRFSGLHDAAYTLTDAITGEAIGSASRKTLEDGEFRHTVKPHGYRLIRMTTEDSAK